MCNKGEISVNQKVIRTCVPKPVELIFQFNLSQSRKREKKLFLIKNRMHKNMLKLILQIQFNKNIDEIE